jgi:hypothetical protein
LVPALSVTCAENENGPLLKGVPLIVPLAPRTVAQNSELTDHAYGGDPPAAATPGIRSSNTPAGSDDVVWSRRGLIVSDTAAVAEIDALSVTRTVTLLDPAVPGVPDIVPPLARLSPEERSFAIDHECWRSPAARAPVNTQFPRCPPEVTMSMLKTGG